MPSLSVVIPCRNDAEALRRTLDRLALVKRGGDVEVIVAAHGDRDATCAAAAGRTRIVWPDGSTRAELMNAGAAAASGPALLFLHADSLLPECAFERIEEALQDPRVLGGAFNQAFAERDWRLRTVSLINRIRYRVTRNYYGDQGLFVRTAVFRRMGGFRRLCLMEDLDFSQRLKAIGRTHLIRDAMPTSGRRFLQRGPWRTLGWCAWLIVLWTCRMDTERYAEAWRGPAGRTPGSLCDPPLTVPRGQQG